MQVLDKGYVKLTDHMGSDLSVVNAARVSFKKESKPILLCNLCGKARDAERPEDMCYCGVGGIGDRQPDNQRWIPTLSPADKRLIAFLIKHGHMSPFRHAFLTFEIKAPLLVARQWWKYVVGSDHTMDGWNEVSRRYVQDDLEFYIPTEWRSAPENKKQGSGAPINSEDAAWLSDRLSQYDREGRRLYQMTLDMGVAIEQARLFMPAYGMYTMWRWSASLQSVMHFLQQRLGDDAQWEIQQYALAVRDLTAQAFPATMEAINL